MNLLPRLWRRVTTVLFYGQFDAAGASGRWPATATMVSQPAAALAARAVLDARPPGWPIKRRSLFDVWTTNLAGDAPSADSDDWVRGNARRGERRTHLRRQNS
jgi:hypothetical protein